MTTNEVAGLLGYSTERVKTLLADGVALPVSGKIVQLAATLQDGVYDISDSQFDEFVRSFEAQEPGRWPPAAVRRELLVESRHRCSICEDAAPIQFHHILDWAKIKHHDPRHMLAVCGTCHTRCTNGSIDHKTQVEYKARLKRTSRRDTPDQSQPMYRRIEDSEQRHWLTPGEQVVLRALQDEFGCKVETNVRIGAGDGWLNLHAAVVRNEDLIAIELYEYKGGGFPFFQIEHFVNVISKTKLDRFQKLVLYVAVASAADQRLDEEVEAQLKKIRDTASCEMQIRMYRINPLRAKYSI